MKRPPIGSDRLCIVARPGGVRMLALRRGFVFGDREDWKQSFAPRFTVGATRKRFNGRNYGNANFIIKLKKPIGSHYSLPAEMSRATSYTKAGHLANISREHYRRQTPRTWDIIWGPTLSQYGVVVPSLVCPCYHSYRLWLVCVPLQVQTHPLADGMTCTAFDGGFP